MMKMPTWWEVERFAGDVRNVFAYTVWEIMTLNNGWWLWRLLVYSAEIVNLKNYATTTGDIEFINLDGRVVWLY